MNGINTRLIALTLVVLLFLLATSLPAQQRIERWDLAIPAAPSKDTAEGASGLGGTTAEEIQLQAPDRPFAGGLSILQPANGATVSAPTDVIYFLDAAGFSTVEGRWGSTTIYEDLVAGGTHDFLWDISMLPDATGSLALIADSASAQHTMAIAKDIAVTLIAPASGTVLGGTETLTYSLGGAAAAGAPRHVWLKWRYAGESESEVILSTTQTAGQHTFAWPTTGFRNGRGTLTLETRYDEEPADGLVVASTSAEFRIGNPLPSWDSLRTLLSDLPRQRSGKTEFRTQTFQWETTPAQYPDSGTVSFSKSILSSTQSTTHDYATLVLLDVTAEESEGHFGGCLTHLKVAGFGAKEATGKDLGTQPTFYRRLRLRMYWDDDWNDDNPALSTPSVDVPLGEFFGIGFARPAYVYSYPITAAYNYYDNNMPAAVNSFFPMPFKRRARAELVYDFPITAADVQVFVNRNVDYVLFKEPVKLPYRFYARYNELDDVTGDALRDFPILPEVPAGTTIQYCGYTLGLQRTDAVACGDLKAELGQNRSLYDARVITYNEYHWPHPTPLAATASPLHVRWRDEYADIGTTSLACLLDPPGTTQTLGAVSYWYAEPGLADDFPQSATPWATPVGPEVWPGFRSQIGTLTPVSTPFNADGAYVPTLYPTPALDAYRSLVLPAGVTPSGVTRERVLTPTPLADALLCFRSTSDASQAGVLTHWSVTLPFDVFLREDHKVRLRWDADDAHRTADVPLRAFFASAVNHAMDDLATSTLTPALRNTWTPCECGTTPFAGYVTTPTPQSYESLPLQVAREAGDVTLTCYLPMPYRERAEVYLVPATSTTQLAADLKRFSVSYISLDADGAERYFRDRGYFQATYSHEINAETRAFHEEFFGQPADPDPDRARIVDVTGMAGHLVGMTLGVRLRDAAWWGEGSLHVYTDFPANAAGIPGASPVAHYPGVEHALNDVWVASRFATFPTHGTVYAHRRGEFAGTGVADEREWLGSWHTAYRFFLQDPVPFNSAIQVSSMAYGWSYPCCPIGASPCTVYVTREHTWPREVADRDGETFGRRLPPADPGRLAVEQTMQMYDTMMRPGLAVPMGPSSCPDATMEALPQPIRRRDEYFCVGFLYTAPPTPAAP